MWKSWCFTRIQLKHSLGGGKTFCIDNEALYDICHNILKINTNGYDQINNNHLYIFFTFNLRRYDESRDRKRDPKRE